MSKLLKTILATLIWGSLSCGLMAQEPTPPPPKEPTTSETTLLKVKQLSEENTKLTKEIDQLSKDKEQLSKAIKQETIKLTLEQKAKVTALNEAKLAIGKSKSLEMEAAAARLDASKALEGQQVAQDAAAQARADTKKAQAVILSLQKPEKEEGSFIEMTMPWLLVGLSCGVMLAMVFIVYRKEKKSQNVITRLKQGQDPVLLLPEEAIRLLHGFVQRNQQIVDDYTTQRQKDYNALSSSQQEHETTLRHFKDKHNDAMKVIVGKIKSILDSSEQHASKTEKHLGTLTPLLEEKEKEIKNFKKGYHLIQIKQVLSSFFKIRDELKADLLTNSDSLPDSIKESLAHYESEIGHAFHEMGIEEIQIAPGMLMQDIEARLWQDLGASETTSDIQKHRTCAHVLQTGYVLNSSPSLPPYVVRKAKVKQYSCPSAGQFAAQQESHTQPNH
jgi:hypothetical protein